MTQTLFTHKNMLFAFAMAILLLSSCGNQAPKAPPADKQEEPEQPQPAPETPPVTEQTTDQPEDQGAPAEEPQNEGETEAQTEIQNEGQGETEVEGQIYKGSATYYSDKFQGKKTASGELYDKDKYTAAVRMNAIPVPFGTMVEVYSEKRKKKVRVRVNDKMSDRAKGIIDLSYKAAEEIGLIIDGRTNVTVRIVKED